MEQDITFEDWTGGLSHLHTNRFVGSDPTLCVLKPEIKYHVLTARPTNAARSFIARLHKGGIRGTSVSALIISTLHFVSCLGSPGLLQDDIQSFVFMEYKVSVRPHRDPGVSLCRQNIIVVVNPCGVEARWEIGLRLAAVDRYVSLTALMLINWVNSFIDIQQVEHESRHHRSRSSLNHLYHFCEFQP